MTVRGTDCSVANSLATGDWSLIVLFSINYLWLYYLRLIAWSLSAKLLTVFDAIRAGWLLPKTFSRFNKWWNGQWRVHKKHSDKLPVWPLRACIRNLTALLTHTQHVHTTELQGRLLPRLIQVLADRGWRHALRNVVFCTLRYFYLCVCHPWCSIRRPTRCVPPNKPITPMSTKKRSQVDICKVRNDKIRSG